MPRYFATRCTRASNSASAACASSLRRMVYTATSASGRRSRASRARSWARCLGACVLSAMRRRVLESLLLEVRVHFFCLLYSFLSSLFLFALYSFVCSYSFVLLIFSVAAVAAAAPGATVLGAQSAAAAATATPLGEHEVAQRIALFAALTNRSSAAQRAPLLRELLTVYGASSDAVRAEFHRVSPASGAWFEGSVCKVSFLFIYRYI